MGRTQRLGVLVLLLAVVTLLGCDDGAVEPEACLSWDLCSGGMSTAICDIKHGQGCSLCLRFKNTTDGVAYVRGLGITPEGLSADWGASSGFNVPMSSKRLDPGEFWEVVITVLDATQAKAMSLSASQHPVLLFKLAVTAECAGRSASLPGFTFPITLCSGCLPHPDAGAD